jgi:hypothetical protein
MTKLPLQEFFMIKKLWLIIFAVSLNAFCFNKNMLTGTWVDLNARPGYARAIVFEKNGNYQDYLFYDKNEKFKKRPLSCVWGGGGKWKVKNGIINLEMTYNASNTQMSVEKFKIIKLEKTTLVLMKQHTKKYMILKKYN